MARWYAAGLVVPLLALSGWSAQPHAAPSGGWSKALFVRGAPQAAGGAADVVSCASAGDCVAAGDYVLSGSDYVFAISEVGGTWGKPVTIPGTARTSKAGGTPGGLACPSAGGCVMAGSYTDTAGHNQAFISSQVRGTWHKIIWVPGLTRLDQGHNAGLGYVSCVSPGNCAAQGTYTNGTGASLPFTVTETGGRWGTAVPVPGPDGLPGQVPGSATGFGPISCASPGNCTAAGSYGVSDGNQVYISTETDGTWGTPKPVPGLVALNTGAEDGISAISCPSPGNCGVGGNYTETDGASDSFVVNQSHGKWDTAREVATTIPGFNADDGDWVNAISCLSAGNCVAGGIDNVEHDALSSSVYIVTEARGKWGQAIPLPGSPELNQGDNATISEISCSSVGNCGAAGNYSAAYDFGFEYTQPFVINEVHGTWHSMLEVPGIKTASLSDGQESETVAISCPAPGRCSAGGNDGDAFVATQP